ncbi:MAG: FMN-binding negative transcriptional regulator [Ignavibacteria bacterium]
MYIPKHNRMKNEDEIFDFIKSNNFGILVSLNDSKITVTHIPFLLKRGEGKYGELYCHIAKANPQHQNISGEILVIFPGAHKYISSGWYESDQAVPTWNYLSVHVYGELQIINERDDKFEIIKDLEDHFEPDIKKYSLDDLKPEYLENLLKGIVAFKIVITSVEGKEKLSQNHSMQRQKIVIDKLYEIADTDSIIIADKMKNILTSDKNSGTDSPNLP